MKYIVEIKEPAWRRMLRHFLWSVICISVIAAVVVGLSRITQAFANFQLQQSAGLLSQFAPSQAVIVAERFSKNTPSTTSLLLLAKTAAEAGAWEVAETALEPISNELDNIKVLSAAALITAHQNPEALTPLLARLAKAVPESDDERFVLAKACIATASPQLVDTALRHLSALDSGILRDRSALLRLKLSLQTGDTHDATERTLALISKNLNPSEAIELLHIAESLKIPEAADYRSALKVRSRSSIALALKLTEALPGTPQSTADWLESLPSLVSLHPEIRLKRFALCLAANNRTGALAAVEGIEPAILKDSLATIADGGSPALEGLSATELSTLARLSVQLEKPLLTARLLQQLSIVEPSLWAYASLAHATDATADTPTALRAWKNFSDRSGSDISRTYYSYLALVTQEGDPKPLYEFLKNLIARYPTHPQVRAAMAMAHLRMGNGTDALLSLPEKPTTLREQFLRGYLLARAGQTTEAAAILKNISPSSLSPAEGELFKAATKKMEASSPVKQWMELIK